MMDILDIWTLNGELNEWTKWGRGRKKLTFTPTIGQRTNILVRIFYRELALSFLKVYLLCPFVSFLCSSCLYGIIFRFSACCFNRRLFISKTQLYAHCFISPNTSAKVFMYICVSLLFLYFYYCQTAVSALFIIHKMHIAMLLLNDRSLAKHFPFISLFSLRFL